MDDTDIVLLNSSAEKTSTSSNVFSIASPDVCQRWTRPSPQQQRPSRWPSYSTPPLHYEHQPQPIITNVISLSPHKNRPITIKDVKSLAPSKQSAPWNQGYRNQDSHKVLQPIIAHVESLSPLKKQREVISKNKSVSISGQKGEPECIVLDDDDAVSITLTSLDSNGSTDLNNLDLKVRKSVQSHSVENGCESNSNTNSSESTHLDVESAKGKPTFIENLEKVVSEDAADCTSADSTTNRKRIKPTLVSSKGSAAATIPQTFQDFKNACLAAADSEADMKKILNVKLDKSFSSSNPSFTKSSTFHDLLLSKMKKVQTDPSNVYVHISELITELKARKASKVDKNQDEPPKKKIKSDSKGSTSVDYEALQDRRNDEKVKKLSKTLSKLQKMIKKLECREVSWDDEKDSSYMQLQRHKQRAVQVFEKLCEYTKESKSAGRIHKIHLSNGTMFPKVNRCVEKFVNSTGEFPDFCDILELMKKTSEEQDMKLSDHEIEDMAKNVFKEIGGEMQRQRGHGVAESLLVFLGDEEDPAETCIELKEKLNENASHWKKIDKVIDEFALKAKEKKGTEEEDKEDEGADDDDDEEEESEQEEDDIENIEDAECSRSENDNDSDNESEASKKSGKDTSD